jgi:hypothetical protein
MIDASQKEGDGERCELKAAQKMIGRQEDLTNTVITADALNTQKDTARAIVERGGEYCIQVKGNQETIRQEAELSTKELAPLLPKQKKHTDESTDAPSPSNALRPCRSGSRTFKPSKRGHPLEVPVKHKTPLHPVLCGLSSPSCFDRVNVVLSLNVRHTAGLHHVV